MSMDKDFLVKTIPLIINPKIHGERDMYPHIRDLFTRRSLGVNLLTSQIVTDSPIFKGSAPDLTIFSSHKNKALSSTDHVFAVIEVKRGNILSQRETIFQEKKKYIQPGTKYFFLIDQCGVYKQEVQYVITGVWEDFSWKELSEPSKFKECFECISRKSASFDDELVRFKDNKTKYAYRDVSVFGRNKFISTVKSISRMLRECIEGMIPERIGPDIKKADKLIKKMESKWGKAIYLWDDSESKVEFAKLLQPEPGEELTSAELHQYEDEHESFYSMLGPYLYALELDKKVLREYASRMGVDDKVTVSFLRSDKNSKRVVAAFAHETSSLIVSRMLMLRFSEDQKFMDRYISNGGVKAFSEYANHFKEGYQALLRFCYEHARNFYHSLFEGSLLDWAVFQDSPKFSDTLLHSMYLLSRWDFQTVKGDILAGVYDHYLEPGKRRALGEVFTRPEVVRYMLKKCDFGATKTLIDPACGSGTFIIEAIHQELERLNKTGMLNADTARKVLKQIAGLDINNFSITLAQMQVLWHLLDLFKKQPSEVKDLITSLLPAISLHGGHNSLDTMGIPMSGGQQLLSDNFLVQQLGEGRDRYRVSRRFQRINSSQYDIVVANPPYVRAHRKQIPDEIKGDYDEITHGQCDLYVFFLYRALKSWAKAGGLIAFIMSLAIFDANYARKIRTILRQYKIIEIVDMELLRKNTFHGVKRPVTILILRNAVPEEADYDIDLVTVTPDCLDQTSDVIDFAIAQRSVVKLSKIFQTHYLPSDIYSRSWVKDLAFSQGMESEWLSKIMPDEMDVLEKLGELPRLADITQVAYSKRNRGKPTEVSLTLDPESEEDLLKWKRSLLIGEGLKLGGEKAFSNSGVPVFKGQNIFGGGLLGKPMGHWDGNYSKVSSQNLYLYSSLFDYSKLFVVRELAQVPMACLHGRDKVYQNTCYLVQLSIEFPLDSYLLSRIVQFYAVKVVRASLIEDLGAHWYKK